MVSVLSMGGDKVLLNILILGWWFGNRFVPGGDPPRPPNVGDDSVSPTPPNARVDFGFWRVVLIDLAESC
jgi:hypothetical protein